MTDEYSDTRRAADTISSAIYAAVEDLSAAMPNGIEPYDYYKEFENIQKELGGIFVQLRRIADHLEANG